MRLDANSEHTLMQYLRGELSAAEREQVSNRLATDDEFFLALEDLEADWIDLLARGELPSEEAGRARRYLAETGQEQRLAVAAALARAASKPPSSHAESSNRNNPAVLAMAQRSGRRAAFFRYSPIAAGLLLAMAALWFAVQGIRVSSPVEDITASAPPPRQAPFVITLLAGVVRGAETVPSFSIPSGTREVELRLEIPPGRRYSRYRVALPGVGDRPEWEHDAVLTGGAEPMAALRLPLTELGARSGELVLYGLSADGEKVALGYYPFQTTAGPR